MIKRYFPPVRETMLVVVITVVFLLLTATCIGLRPEHFLMAGLFFVLFFAGKTTRKLAVALLPFIIFGVSYDWMRVYPNYQVNPIDVQGRHLFLANTLPYITGRLLTSLQACSIFVGCLCLLFSVCGFI